MPDKVDPGESRGENPLDVWRKPQTSMWQGKINSRGLSWWLRVRAPNAGGPGSIPAQGTGSHILQLRPGTAKKKIKKKGGGGQTLSYGKRKESTFLSEYI